MSLASMPPASTRFTSTVRPGIVSSRRSREWAEAEKGDYPNFMLKEMFEQPAALRRGLSGALWSRTVAQSSAALNSLLANSMSSSVSGSSAAGRPTMLAAWARWPSSSWRASLRPQRSPASSGTAIR